MRLFSQLVIRLKSIELSLVAWAEKAKSLGFKAVKSEVTLNGPYAHSGLNENDDKTTEVVAAVRKALRS